jgi:hypothetical protein
MRIVLNKGEDAPLIFETDNIADTNKLLESNAIIRTVSVIDIIVSALQLSSGAYRDTLEKKLLECTEARIEEGTEED